VNADKSGDAGALHAAVESAKATAILSAPPGWFEVVCVQPWL